MKLFLRICGEMIGGETFNRLLREDEGILTFEWILLMTLLGIGVVGGVAGMRDAIIHESQGVVGAMVSLDQSYQVAPPLGVSVEPLVPAIGPHALSGASYSRFYDSAIWSAGRLDAGQLNNIHQTYEVRGDLSSLSLP